MGSSPFRVKHKKLVTCYLITYWSKCIFPKLENVLINVLDKLAPLTMFVEDKTKDSKCPKDVSASGMS